jgi:hypothetical protein
MRAEEFDRKFDDGEDRTEVGCKPCQMASSGQRCGRGYQADAWHGHQVARSGEPSVRPCSGLTSDAEPLGQLVAGRHRITGRPLPGPDLSLDDPRDAVTGRGD